MTTIHKGITNDVGTKFWQIFDDTQSMIAEFNHNRFPHILSGAEVYFIDLNLDRLCENVQIVVDVDMEIKRATPSYGIETNAEDTLRDYIMSALLHALDKQGSARTKYLEKLKEKMFDVMNEAKSQGSVVTLAILSLNGIG